MAGKYTLMKTSSGQFRFVLKAANGEIILTSETYVSKAAAMGGVEAVAANSSIDSRYERKTVFNGQHMFTLKAANGQVVGASELYSSAAGRDGGIEAVKRIGKSASVDDRT